MDYSELYDLIKKKASFLCVGLDPVIEEMPADLRGCEFPLFEFNRAIIDATHEFAVAYKPNTAFYEAEGASGWKQLEMTVDYIRGLDDSLFVIADAKRGDIGNTAGRYAKAFFETMDCNAVTLAPYMGKDSVMPFLDYEGRWAIVLALTSNASADDFEILNVNDRGNNILYSHESAAVNNAGSKVVDSAGSEVVDSAGSEVVDGAESKVVARYNPLYRRVIEESMKWGNVDNTMFVVGATRPEELAVIRRYCPDHFLLVPGVGAQGGTIAEVVRYGMNDRCGLLVNMSRDIIYAWKRDKSRRWDEGDFAVAAGAVAEATALEMKQFL
jgi:orotidine-5'-phosphate decarboxylase